ncbi:mucin-13-like [Lampetra planeri]
MSPALSRLTVYASSGISFQTSIFCPNGSRGNEKGVCVKCDGYATGINCLDCPDGYTNENGVCKECSFGYSGQKCKEPFLLVVVVVSTIGGAALIALITAVIVLSVRKHSTKGDVFTSASNFRMSYRAHSKSLRSQVGDEKALAKGGNPYEDIEPVTFTNPAYKNDKSSSSDVYY